MKRSRLTIIFIMASIVMIIISFFVPSQLTPDINFVYVVGMGFILMLLIACLFAFKEKSSRAMRSLSARSLCGFSVFLTFLFFLGLFNPARINTFGLVGGPYSVTQNELFFLLWVISSILLIIAALVYEDPILKRMI